MTGTYLGCKHKTIVEGLLVIYFTVKSSILNLRSIAVVHVLKTCLCGSDTIVSSSCTPAIDLMFNAHAMALKLRFRCSTTATGLFFFLYIYTIHQKAAMASNS